ncbi:hypothetical protein BGX27_002645 [Mortierella sp. AM989]|nr:hypothetical protein BGX27_002645 [Mortierella sp. AM989]
MESNKSRSCCSGKREDDNSHHNANLDPTSKNLTLELSRLALESDHQSQTTTAVSSPSTRIEEDVPTIDPELLPVNWPSSVKYLIDYHYHPSIPSHILDLVRGFRQKQKDRFENIQSKDESLELEVEDEPRSEIEKEYDDIPIGHAIPGVLRHNSDPPYEIRLITSPPNHPVLGSYGLFATRTLRPRLHLLDYISLVVPDEHADPDSDHTLYLCNDLNLDASIHGNHGRFVNDFRNIRTYKQGPNVAWDLYRDAETGQVRMGCKVLKSIQPGEEILCTYGKAYWKSRGVVVTGREWEDEWDTDPEDQSDDDKQERDQDKTGSN